MPLDDDKYGWVEGQVCGRKGCTGVLIEEEPDSDMSCACHIHPPCAKHSTDWTVCPVCDWRGRDEPPPIDYYPMAGGFIGIQRDYARDLDPTKIDYRSLLHTHFTMIKKGVYPMSGDDNKDRRAVEEVVRGTFGGRFNSFGNGRFEYVAYTD